jgi:hypothetical protein
MSQNNAGYGRKWTKWLPIYLAVAVAAYFVIYLLFFAHSGGGGGSIY